MCTCILTYMLSDVLHVFICCLETASNRYVIGLDSTASNRYVIDLRLTLRDLDSAASAR